MPRKKQRDKFSFLRSKTLRQKQGLILILVGLIFIGISSYWRHLRSRVLSFERRPQEIVSEGSPAVFIEIPSARINLPVEEGRVVNGTWLISENGASHLDKSANPGQKGNIVIYAHNKNFLFGPLKWVEFGKEIIITNKDGKIFTYKIEKIVEVTPKDISFILPTNDETLTVYTCIGFADSKRLIVIAKRV